MNDTPQSAERRIRARVEQAGGALTLTAAELRDEFGFRSLTPETRKAIASLLGSERIDSTPSLEDVTDDGELILQSIGPAPALGKFFETFGKALGTIAGLAVFVYVIGGLTVLARLQRLELPAESIVPEIPRERLALLGLSQLLTTLVIGGLIAAIALALLPARGADESWRQWFSRLRRQNRRKWIPAVALIAVLVLLAPVSANGFVYIAALLLGATWFVGSWRRLRNPLTGLLVALLIAGAVTVLRQLEFPSPFGTARVTVTTEAAPLIPEAPEGEIRARVIETTDDAVLLGYESPETQALEEATGGREPPILLVVPRDIVERIAYDVPLEPQSHADPLGQQLLKWSPLPSSWRIPPMCLVPTCEWDTTSEIEHREPTFSLPFVF